MTYGNLHRGFEYPMIKFIVITEGDMFGVEKKKRKRKKTSYEGTKIQNFSDLAVGDYVVHEDHGLGIYRGIEKIEQDGRNQGLLEGRVRRRGQSLSAGNQAGRNPEIRRL